MLTGDIVRYNAMKYPDKLGLMDLHSRYTWKEFNQRTNQLAHALQRRGVKKGDLVTLLSKNLTECYLAFFACAKIGAVYAPINYRFAPVEIVSNIQDASPKVLLVHALYAETVRGIADQFPDGVQLIGFGEEHGFADDLNTVLQLESTDEPVPDQPIHEDDLCWICYTGGTTGSPKGVMLSHRNNFTQIHNLHVADRARHEDIYMVTGALFHIFVNIGLGYIYLGCSTLIIDFKPDLALEMVEKENITAMILSASMLQMVIDEQRNRPRKVSSLRLIGTGAAPVSAEGIRQAKSLLNNCHFVQYFGQTEAAHHFTYLSIDDYERGCHPNATEKERKRLESGGRVQHACLMKIVDPDTDEELPRGQVGEICASGDNVMMGYWNKDEQTAIALRNNWLHTGDMGYMDEDGYVYIVDRLKDMIVSGGENVFSQEVERVIHIHPAVSQVAVIGVPDAFWGEAVKALIILQEGKTAGEQEIIEFCRPYLAGYKVPKSVEFLASFPTTPTGKVLKRELKAKYWGDRKRLVGEGFDSDLLTKGN